MNISDLLAETWRVTTMTAADSVLNRMVSRMMAEEPEMLPVQAEYACRQRIGHHSGTADDHTRAKVERLFKTAHPIFGAIKYNGPPTQAQRATLGVEFGRLVRDGHVDSRDRLAQLPRVDCRRMPCSRDTGILVRAIGLDGKWGSYDIACLTCDSLICFLRSRGGRNLWAESTVLIILGYEVPESLHAHLQHAQAE